MEYCAIEDISHSDSWIKKKISDSKDFQNLAFEKVNELVIKQRKGKIVTLTDGTELIEFVSCGYLGLDQDPRIINAITHNIDKLGVTFPVARTRMVAENFIVLESLLNQIFCNAHTVLFGSLHLTHLGVIPIIGSGELPSFPISRNGAVFILDKTVHSSVQINRALIEQLGKTIVLNINDLDLVETTLKKYTNMKMTPIIISDSLGSMGGIAPVKQLMDFSDQYNAYIYLDDAHGTSIHGKHGAGFVLHVLKNQFHPKLILGSTLAKAFGSVAGVVGLPTQKDAQFIKRFAPTYVFGGPPFLPAINAGIASAHIHLSNEIYSLQEKLWDNVNFFDSLDIPNIIHKQKDSPIRCVSIGNEYKAIETGYKLRQLGFALTTAAYPTVRKGQSILRLTLAATHTRDQILALSNGLKKVL